MKKVILNFGIVLAILLITGCRSYQVHRYANKTAKMLCKASDLKDKLTLDKTAMSKREINQFKLEMEEFEAKMKRKFTSKDEQQKMEKLIGKRMKKICKGFSMND
jgi:uncharacterized protein YcfL